MASTSTSTTQNRRMIERRRQAENQKLQALLTENVVELKELNKKTQQDLKKEINERKTLEVKVEVLTGQVEQVLPNHTNEIHQLRIDVDQLMQHYRGQRNDEQQHVPAGPFINAPGVERSRGTTSRPRSQSSPVVVVIRGVELRITADVNGKFPCPLCREGKKRNYIKIHVLNHCRARNTHTI